jgi:hypothetical protein
VHGSAGRSSEALPSRGLKESRRRRRRSDRVGEVRRGRTRNVTHLIHGRNSQPLPFATRALHWISCAALFVDRTTTKALAKPTPDSR